MEEAVSNQPSAFSPAETAASWWLLRIADR